MAGAAETTPHKKISTYFSRCIFLILLMSLGFGVYTIYGVVSLQQIVANEELESDEQRQMAYDIMRRVSIAHGAASRFVVTQTFSEANTFEQEVAGVYASLDMWQKRTRFSEVHQAIDEAVKVLRVFERRFQEVVRLEDSKRKLAENTFYPLSRAMRTSLSHLKILVSNERQTGDSLAYTRVVEGFQELELLAARFETKGKESASLAMSRKTLEECITAISYLKKNKTPAIVKKAVLLEDHLVAYYGAFTEIRNLALLQSKLYSMSYEPLEKEFLKSMDTMMKILDAKVRVGILKVDERLHHYLWLCAVCLVVFIIIIVILGFGLSRRLISPVGAILNSVNTLSDAVGQLNGKLSSLATGDIGKSYSMSLSKISVEGDDEFYVLGAGLNSIADEMNRVQNSVQQLEMYLSGMMQSVTEISEYHWLETAPNANDDEFELPSAFVEPASVGDGLALAMGKMADSLYYTVQQLKDQLLMAERQINEAELQKKQRNGFVNFVSYEIRTPLQSVLGLVQILKDTPLNSHQQKCMESLCVAGELLEHFVSNVLDLSKANIDQLKLSSMPFSAEEIARNVVGVIAHKAKSRQKEISFMAEKDLPKMVVGDVYKYRQLVFNLLDIAISGAQRTDVEFVLSSNVEKGEIIGTISSEGNAEYLKKVRLIQSDFVQGGRNERGELIPTDSLSLGLGVSYMLMDAMGGELQFNIGHASRFEYVFTLRLGEPSLVTPAQPLDVD
ncbi:MAG: sensor histidine kinase [Desulfovibrio sp.]